jgi:hypothetical protein
MASTKKSSKKIKKASKMQSFHLSKEANRFLSFKLTEQTIYWIILLVLILGLSLWVLNIQLRTTDILNSISVLK